MTDDALYQLSTNLSVMVRIPLIEINAVTMIRKSAVLTALHCPFSYDHLLEVFRRTEFVMFLIHVFDKRKFKRPALYYADGLRIQNEEKEEMMRFDPAEADEKSKNATLLRELQSNNFVNAAKFGYLLKKSESWFKSWTEKFCVLTNVGLLYYNDPAKRPRSLFPVIDSKISKVKESEFGRRYVFKIRAFNWSIVLAAQTREDYESWINHFIRLQEETEQRKQKMMKDKGVVFDVPPPL